MGEDAPHGLRRLELCVGGNVGIGVQCEARGVMTEHTADGLDVHAVLQRHGGEGVTQVMEAYPWQSRPLQHSLQHMQDAVW